MKILIIDDEKDIVSFLSSGLKEKAYIVDCAYDGTKGAFMAKTSHYDLIVLDYNLPEKDGLSVLKEIRKSGVKSLVLALTVSAELDKKELMFKNGVDDYITKPFLIQEFMWRIEALLRRPLNIKIKNPRLGDLQLDTKKQIAIRKNRRIYLTNKEYSLLELFFRRRDEVLSRSQIMENVWEYNADPFSNSIETHIVSLRKKLNQKGEENYIHTFTGRGYKFGLRKF